jgi:hypothetical protein
MLATMRPHAELPGQTTAYSVWTTGIYRHRGRLFVVQHDAKRYIRVDGSMNTVQQEENREL